MVTGLSVVCIFLLNFFYNNIGFTWSIQDYNSGPRNGGRAECYLLFLFVGRKTYFHTTLGTSKLFQNSCHQNGTNDRNTSVQPERFSSTTAHRREIPVPVQDT